MMRIPSPRAMTKGPSSWCRARLVKGWMWDDRSFSTIEFERLIFLLISCRPIERQTDEYGARPAVRQTAVGPMPTYRGRFQAQRLTKFSRSFEMLLSYPFAGRLPQNMIDPVASTKFPAGFGTRQ